MPLLLSGAAGMLWRLVGRLCVCVEVVGGFWGEGLMLLNITSLLFGDAPQRRPTTGRCAFSEVGVGYAEDFAAGGGGYGRKQEPVI